MQIDYVKAIDLPALGNACVMPKIEQVHQCVICGKAWDNPQSLRAHMKAHKGTYSRTSLHFETERWKEFKKLCKNHKTTTCHVLNTVVKGLVDGEKTGNISLPKILSPNPVIINIHDYFLSGPRSRYKIPFEPSRVAHNMQPIHCPVCGSKKVRVVRTSDGFEEGRCACGACWLIRPT